MKSCLIFIIALPLSIFAQTGWTWEELPSMPERIANNAVCEGFVGDTAYVYSFSGIDSTKMFSGINLTSMRYNTITEEWSMLPDLPDTLGKIAAGASYVNGKIYIIGGYHVFSNNSELSSNKVHVFDPESNSYLEDGADLPIQIDDQVQAVWRDSLIYVVTGWSDNGNVSAVQIYNPYTNEWQMGTSTPNSGHYRSFGASGVIIGDTIFYNGGAIGVFFNSTGRLRKGVINPNNPTEIEWSDLGDNPGAEGYRMAAVNVDDKAFWIGGSGVTYNYNGIAYNGSGGVSPLNRILRYNSESGNWFEGLGAPYGIMDLRGAAQISETQFVICGGMEAGQEVTNRAFLLTFDPLNSVGLLEENPFDVFPNPAHSVINVNLDQHVADIVLFDSSAKKVLNRNGLIGLSQIDISKLPSGNYILQIRNKEGIWMEKVLKE